MCIGKQARLRSATVSVLKSHMLLPQAFFHPEAMIAPPCFLSLTPSPVLLGFLPLLFPILSTQATPMAYPKLIPKPLHPTASPRARKALRLAYVSTAWRKIENKVLRVDPLAAITANMNRRRDHLVMQDQCQTPMLKCAEKTGIMSQCRICTSKICSYRS